MTHKRFLTSSAAGLVAAAILAQSAVAGGEQKNQWPFTRPVDTRSAQGVAQAATSADPAIRGEAKNEAPFTRPATVLVAGSGGGFDWTAGAIGGLAGLGIAFSGAGVVLVARKSPLAA